MSNTGVLAATEAELVALAARVTTLEQGTSDTGLAARVSAIEATLAAMKAALMGATAVITPPAGGGTVVTPPAGGGTVVTPPPGGGTTVTPPAGTVWTLADAFPADVSRAPYPSPPGSNQSVINGVFSGVPYIKDANDGLWGFVLDASGNPIPNNATNNPIWNGSAGYVNLINGGLSGDGAIEIRVDEIGPYYVSADGVSRRPNGTGGSEVISVGALTGAPYAPNVIPDPANTTIFPSNIGLAPTSPPGTHSRVYNGKVVGDPYVMSNANVPWMFKSDASGNAVPNNLTTNPGGNNNGGFVYTVNGVPSGDGAIDIRVGGDGVIYYTTADGTDRKPNGNGGSATLNPPPVTGGSATGAPPVVTAPGTPPADPTPLSPAPGATGTPITFGTGTPNATFGAAVALLAAGGSIKFGGTAGQVFLESPQLPAVALSIDGGGRVVNPGDANASYTPGAILDATGMADSVAGNAYAHQQGGVVPMVDAVISGWEIRKFGMLEAQSGGTGGVRNDGPGIFRLSELYLHDNEDGVGNHEGDQSVFYLQNILAFKNGLYTDGKSHNFYIPGSCTKLYVNGVTSISPVGAASGGIGLGGHALKTRATQMFIAGKNYFYSGDAACIDISGSMIASIGQAVPADGTTIQVPGRTVIQKKAGDDNHCIFNYGANGDVFGTLQVDADFIIDCDAPFINITGPVNFAPTCTFKNAAGVALPAGTIQVQGGGSATGLP